jgi:endoglucanase Acf2
MTFWNLWVGNSKESLDIVLDLITSPETNITLRILSSSLKIQKSKTNAFYFFVLIGKRNQLIFLFPFRFRIHKKSNK